MIGWGKHDPVPNHHKTLSLKLLIMKTALKLNKKQLFELYEKSSPQVKESLRAEFGEGFFVVEESKVAEVIIPKAPQRKIGQLISWEMIFDFTPALRMLGYAFLLGLIFSNI